MKETIGWLSAVYQDEHLTTVQRAVAGSLWSFMDRRGVCWPSVPAIGERAGLKRPETVRAALAVLVERRYITVRLQPRGRLSTNEYKAVDNHARGTVKPSTAGDGLTSTRGTVQPFPQGGRSNRPRTKTIRTSGGSTPRTPVDNPYVAYLSEATRIP